MQTPVSQSNLFVHMDPKVFPDAEAFKPERWIEAKEDGVRLDRYLVSFSKGSRQCVGIKYEYFIKKLHLVLIVLQPCICRVVSDPGYHHSKVRNGELGNDR